MIYELDGFITHLQYRTYVGKNESVGTTSSDHKVVCITMQKNTIRKVTRRNRKGYEPKDEYKLEIMWMKKRSKVHRSK